jgi:regulator of PEP synthase PpsR (kinase-PPPase family)
MSSDAYQMNDPREKQQPNQLSKPIFILSGGVGSSGEQLVRTVMAQFPGANIRVEIFPKVFTGEQVEEILTQAINQNAIVAHTFVDPELRKIAYDRCNKSSVQAVDLVGPLIETLAEILEQSPLGKPGLYRQLYKSYFDRIDAMDFALDHDDGKNAKGWAGAEIVLLGASRVGKTPISLYLSVLGWKVANVPLIAGISPPEELQDLDPRRLVGLTISPGELIEHRKHRQRTLGVSRHQSDYIDPQKVYAEVENIEDFLRRNRISIIDVSGKPIETTADEIIRQVRHQLVK